LLAGRPEDRIAVQLPGLVRSLRSAILVSALRAQRRNDPTNGLGISRRQPLKRSFECAQGCAFAKPLL